MRKKERLFLKCTDRNRRSTLRQEFKNSQSVFDKHLRQTERAYRISYDLNVISVIASQMFYICALVNCFYLIRIKLLLLYC